MPLILAKVWHYWLSFALLGPAILIIVGLGVSYLAKVVSAKYPKQ